MIYGVAVMMVGSGTTFFLFWYVLGALLLAAGWAVHAAVWEGLPVAVRRTIEVVLCLALVGFLATTALTLKDFGDEGEPDLDYIIVLGAQVREDGPSIVLKNRLDKAVEYLEANPRTICIVSGGQGPNEHTAEAPVMAAYLEERGIDPARILQENQAEDTNENIAFSSKYFDPDRDSVGILTNNFHVFRGLAIARKQGLEHAVGIAAPSVPLFLPNNMVRESLAIVKAALKGTI